MDVACAWHTTTGVTVFTPCHTALPVMQPEISQHFYCTQSQSPPDYYPVWEDPSVLVYDWCTAND